MTKNKSNTIILCGGKINYSNLPVNTNTNNSMIPVNGKPVISWIIEDLIEKKILSVQIVLLQENTHLKNFLKRVFNNKINLIINELEESSDILQSLYHGLKESDINLPTRVILGDTLIRDSFAQSHDMIYIQEVEDCHRWCTVEYDEEFLAQKYYDKVYHAPLPYMALCGYYFFSNTSALLEIIQKCIEKGKNQLSDILTVYQKKTPIKVVQAKKWFDFGSIDNLIKAKQGLLQSRYFNTLTINPILNTITKISEFDEKLRDELDWYRLLPEELRVVSPRILNSEEINGKLNLVQEYYGYPTLAELYLYSDIEEEVWISIFKKLLELHKIFLKYNITLNKSDVETIYIVKTIERVKTLEKDEYWKNIFEYPEVVINGEVYQNFHALEDKIIEKCRLLSENTDGTIIHGDYCFSNILFDLNNQIIRLIDPRGSFGKKGIYGDPRYDLAKLRHSICGFYDYIVAEMFEIENINNKFSVEFFINEVTIESSTKFDSLIENIGYKSKDIQFIEGLLFISMLPLHKDKPQRQKAMYTRGIQIINKVLCE